MEYNVEGLPTDRIQILHGELLQAFVGGSERLEWMGPIINPWMSASLEQGQSSFLSLPQVLQPLGYPSVC